MENLPCSSLLAACVGDDSTILVSGRGLPSRTSTTIPLKSVLSGIAGIDSIDERMNGSSTRQSSATATRGARRNSNKLKSGLRATGSGSDEARVHDATETL